MLWRQNLQLPFLLRASVDLEGNSGHSAFPWPFPEPAACCCEESTFASHRCGANILQEEGSQESGEEGTP